MQATATTTQVQWLEQNNLCQSRFSTTRYPILANTTTTPHRFSHRWLVRVFPHHRSYVTFTMLHKLPSIWPCSFHCGQKFPPFWGGVVVRSNSLRGRYFRLDFHRDCYVLLLASALTGYFCLGKCRSSGIFALENSTIETLFCLILSDAFRLLSKGTTFCHIQSPAYPALVDYFSYFAFGAKFCGTQIKRTSSKLWSGTVELENSMLRCGGVWGSIDAG